MADSHHHHHRPHRLSVPPRSTLTAVQYPPGYSLTPTPTPSKHRLSQSTNSIHNKSSISFLLLLLFSLRSLYSLLPFLRSSPSFSLFPFSFLVSFLSFILTLIFSLYSKHPRVPVFSLSSLSQSQIKHLVFKSLLLAIVFLLRFQALRYCGAAAMILSELSGNIAFKFWKDQDRDRDGHSRVRGFFALFVGQFFLSVSWDRMDCFPLSHSNLDKFRNSLMLVVDANCLRIVPMLLPFLSGFLGCYEKDLMNLGTIKQLGRRRVQLISLFFTTCILLFPAIVNMLVFEAEGGSVSIMNLGWLLANTVLFGVLLNEWYNDEKWISPRDSEKEYLVTFVCTLVLELVYFPELSLWGLLICGLLLWIAIRQLNWGYTKYVELGAESSETFSSMVMRPIRHVLNERKSRKIALFLMINTGYMVVEFVVGFMSNSLGLLSDACHMLFDCAALAIGLYASYISRLPATSQFNYGRGRFEVLSGYVNAVFLVLVGALIVLESLERILDPQEISTNSLLAVSIGGLLVNVVGLIFFHEEHHHAHGGSCSHSISHSHSHSQSHAHHDHDHHTQIKDHESVFVSEDRCSHDEGKHDSLDKHHECQQHDHGHSHEHHDHSHSHVHHNHDHHHVHHEHDHHHVHHDRDHSHNVGHHDHDHGHNVGRHDPDHSCKHHDHGNEKGHQDDHNTCSSHNHHVDSKTESSQKKHHHQHQHIDHNMEGIFLHVLADTLGSVGVVISTLLIKYKGWLAADPACSIFISVLIVSSVIPLLRNSAEILLQRVPRAHEQDIKAAVNDVMKIKGVSGLQNLHVWSLTNTDVIGTLHLRVSSEVDKAATKARVLNIFQDAGVKDLMLEVECVKSL